MFFFQKAGRGVICEGIRHKISNFGIGIMHDKSIDWADTVSTAEPIQNWMARVASIFFSRSETCRATSETDTG